MTQDLKKLKDLTDTKGGKIPNMHKTGPLAQAIRAAIFDWEVRWEPERYPQVHAIQPGMIFTKKEREDLASRVHHALRGLVW